MNPFKALTSVPFLGNLQIFGAILYVESERSKRIIQGDFAPGDLGLGQTGWNPFNFNYSEEEYFEKQVQEIKHGRLAMIAAAAELLQVKASGLNPVQQLAAAFSQPESRAFLEGPGALGDYFPQGL